MTKVGHVASRFFRRSTTGTDSVEWEWLPVLKTIAYTDTSPVFSRPLRRRDSWTNGDMHAIRRLPDQLFEGIGARTFLHSNRLSSCCRRGKYPHSTEPVPRDATLDILRSSGIELPILGTKLPILRRQFQNERTVR